MDPRTSELQPHYQAFGSNKYRIPVEPSRGEWIALELGRKPMLRLVLQTEAWQSMRASCEARGLFTATASVAVLEEPLDGETRPSENANRIVAFVGRDRDCLREAANIDSAMLSGGVDEPGWRNAGRRLGELLGYPSCCVEHFIQLPGDHGNLDAVRAAAARTHRFEPLLNNLSMSFVHATCWYPCSYDCQASLRVAADVDRRLAEELGSVHALVRRVWGMPRLCFDDRRQLLFEGTMTSDRVRYRSVHAPSMFEAPSPSVMTDWIFYADVVRRVALGDELVLAGETLELRKRGRRVGEISCSRPPVLLPFG